MTIPLPDPPLSEGVLRLRPWCLEESPALVAAWTDPEVARWTSVPPRCDDAFARRWIEGDEQRREQGLSLDLVVDVGGEVVGEVGLSAIDALAGRADIGWWIAADHRRQRYAVRAVRLLADWAVETGLVEALVAHCHPDNPASSAVAERAGFVERAAGVDGTRLWRFSRLGRGGTLPA
ncbi:MAG TPA: GNAT family N-acetyltransferase [Acidimicrobiales bacterium]|nr:GNAT family N-acetyltransferase [Acidimicrobiales bacterium]